MTIMLSLKDLDFENNGKSLKHNLELREREETIADIRNTRQILGKMTVRDAMEAVYGEAYTRHMMGEDGGKDILVEELRASDDIRQQAGKPRTDIGGNRLPARDLNESDRRAARDALDDQEKVVDAAIQDGISDFYREDAKAYRNQKVVEDLNNMLPEDRVEIIRLLQEQVARGK
jgi:hypothetical protein